MNRQFITITKISLAIIFSLLFFSCAFASEINNPVDENGSMYKYSAIENTNSFPDLKNNTNISDSQLSVNTDIPQASFNEKLQSTIDDYNFSKSQISKAMNEINSRGGMETFLVGNNLGVLKFQMVQINDQISKLNALGLETDFVAEKDKISQQLKLVTEEKKKVDDYIFFIENKFSIFGWLVNSL
jgi:hypothetical protein